MPIGWGSGSSSSSSGDVTSVNGKTGDVTISKSTIGLGNVDNTADEDKPVSDDTQDAIDDVSTTMTTQIALCLKKTQLGVANGVASLNSNGSLAEDQIPESLLSGLKWQSVWDADSDDPTLPTASSDYLGYFYKVSVAGTYNSVTYTVGDWVICSSTTTDDTTTYSWERVPSTTESATTTSEGTLELAGDLGGTSSAPTIESIQGITVPTTAPEEGNFLVASSASVLEYRDIEVDDLPEATTAAEGIIQLTQDLGGESDAPLVEGVQGYTIDNDPSIGVDYVLGVSDLTNKKLTWIAQTGGSGVTSSYIQTKLDSSQSDDISVGDHVKFADEVLSIGSDISLDTSGTYSSSITTSNIGRFTLAAGRTYRMVANAGKLSFSSTSEDSYALLQWYDVTNSKALGTSTTSYAVTSTSAVSSSGTTETIYKATSEVIVELRIIDESNLTSINGDYDTSHDCASALIYVVAGDVAVTGQSVDYSLGYMTTDTVLTSGDDIIFDTVSGNLDYETSSGCWTLNSGTTYQLTFNGQFNSFTNTSTGSLCVEWVDANNTALVDGGIMTVVPLASETTNASNPSTNIIYTPSVDIAVKLRVVSSDGSASLWANENSVVIKQLGTSSVSTMIGASSSEDGTEGTVPAPDTGDQDYTLHGDATWRVPYSTIVQDSSKNLTIGSSGDDETLTIYRNILTGTGNTFNIYFTGSQVNSDATSLPFSVQSTDDTFTSLISGSDKGCALYFGDAEEYNSGGIVYDNSSDILGFRASDTYKAYINSDGLSIGAVGDCTLYVYTGSSSVSRISSADIYMSADSNSYMQMAVPNGSTTGIYFGAPLDSDGGRIKYINNSSTASSSYLVLGANSADTLYINGDKVGINTIPEAPLHIYAGNSSCSVNSYSTIFTENSTNNYIQIAGGTSYTCSLLFCDSGGTRGQVSYDHSSDTMYFVAGGSSKLYLNSSGMGIGGDPSAYHLVNITSTSSWPLAIKSPAGATSYGGIYSSETSYSVSSYASAHMNIWRCYTSDDAILYAISYYQGKFYMSNYTSITTGVYLGRGSTSWTSTSDIRLKTNVEDISYGLDAVNKMEPIIFDYTETASDSSVSQSLGFSAQAMYKIVPECVNVGDDEDVKSDGTVENQWGIQYTELIPVLVKAIQELNAKVNILESAS